MKANWTDKFFELAPKLQKLFVIIGALFLFSFGIYKGISTSYGLAAGIFIGLVGAVLVIGTYALTGIWNIATTSLAEFFSRNPKFRRNIIIFLSLSTFFSAFYIVFYTNVDNFLKASIFILFLILLPSGITSLIREDRRRESFKLLGSQITPTLISQSPQAAIEHAFTLFEDHLRKRLDMGASEYGETLINLALGKDGKLFYGETASENRGARNLLSGAYATYRNPRKHRIVEDDKESALAIIALIELLIHIVDSSSDREK